MLTTRVIMKITTELKSDQKINEQLDEYVTRIVAGNASTF
jgi:hypothetical protein